MIPGEPPVRVPPGSNASRGIFMMGENMTLFLNFNLKQIKSK